MKRRDLKILWSSNAAFSNSGYGRFTDDFSQRLLKDGWPIRLIAWAGLAGGNIEYKGITNYPQTESMWGEDALKLHGDSWGANVRFSFQDVHAMNPMWLQQMPNWIPYVPIDRWEVQPQVLANLRYAYKIITFSEFGQKALQNQGFASTMIHEGVDTSVFKPLDKIATRNKWHFPQDKFIFGMIGANKPDGISRKGWQQALESFAKFVEKYPESLFFWETNQPGGFDIQGYANFLGVGDKLLTIPPYQAIYNSTAESVNEWLNCCDILLHPSTTEGFGLVVTEAQAAGTPVIINDCMSMPELIDEGKTGEKCKSNFKLWTMGGGYIYFPDPLDLAMKMESMYIKVKENENKISTSCRAWIKDNYDIDKIYKEQWLPYLESLQGEFLPLEKNKE